MPEDLNRRFWHTIDNMGLPHIKVVLYQEKRFKPVLNDWDTRDSFQPQRGGHFEAHAVIDGGDLVPKADGAGDQQGEKEPGI